jgi:hypothetical protein
MGGEFGDRLQVVQVCGAGTMAGAAQLLKLTLSGQ